MGGLGSGRHDYATTPTVEECCALEVDEFIGVLEDPGSSVMVRWGPEDDPSASIGVHLLPQHGDADTTTALRLVYTITDGRTGEQTAHDYRIPLEYTECNFGGERPWFRCPGVVDGGHCDRRVAKLYRPPRSDLYLCRHCYDLGYTSSRTSGDDLKQAELRYRRSYAKLDEQGRRPHPNNETVPHIPDRPSNMHHDTYEALVEELELARQEWEDAWIARLRQITPYPEHI